MPLRGPDAKYTKFDAAKIYLNSVQKDIIYRKIQSAKPSKIHYQSGEDQLNTMQRLKNLADPNHAITVGDVTAIANNAD